MWWCLGSTEAFSKPFMHAFQEALWKTILGTRIEEVLEAGDACFKAHKGGLQPRGLQKTGSNYRLSDCRPIWETSNMSDLFSRCSSWEGGGASTGVDHLKRLASSCRLLCEFGQRMPRLLLLLPWDSSCNSVPDAFPNLPTSPPKV